MRDSKLMIVARKELTSFFASPVAYIFLGTFLVVSLFTFFFVETFFARNIVDVQPLFRWMPTLLIFLVAALTMRSWSEERRSGTLDFLFTVPIRTVHLVLGKFLACLSLVALALLLTWSLPVSVSLLGDLDWGPVIGAYVASVLLAGAYIAIGLYVSSRSENQIVSLIVTIVVCSLFYLVGSSQITSFFGSGVAEFLQLLGTGSRFESIERGILDIRDLYYYASLMGVFLTLNVFALEKMKWSVGTNDDRHKKQSWIALLVVVNFLVANIWLTPTRALRADLTEGNLYSISPATEQVLSQLQEPLLIRGYFSDKTHPLLAPLVPQIRNLIKEYQFAGGDKVRAEFIDPRGDAELEEEANTKYSIKPVPFQIPDKYQVALVNSYFNVLIQYGDQFEVLGFRELIDVKVMGEGALDVRLRNPEYDLTRSIKKVMQGFQNTDSLFASLTKPVLFRGFISGADKLPAPYQSIRDELTPILNELKTSSGGKFDFSIVNPEEGDGSTANQIEEMYGFRPMGIPLLGATYYFYMVLEGEGRTVLVPLPENGTKEGLERSLESALARFSPGFLRTVGIVTPAPKQPNPMLGMAGGGRQFQFVQETLQQTKQIKSVDLSKGVVPDDVDLLLVLSPEKIDERGLFAMDQFLMQGGTVVLSTAQYGVERSQAGLKAAKVESGLTDWLTHYGVSFDDGIVMDLKNEPYPVPVRRNLGGFVVEELRMVPYPPFVDVRSEGMNQKNSMTAGIPQVTLNWPSALKIDGEKNKERTVTELLSSSTDSWASLGADVEPKLDQYEYGFPVPEKRSEKLLAVLIEGQFRSFFEDKTPPIYDTAEEPSEEGAEEEEKPEDTVLSGVIARSPESARLIVFGSNEFLSDQVLRISAGGGNRFQNTLALVENSVDWALEDRSLLSIRARGHFSRTLIPLSEGQKMLWEYGNYGVVLVGLLLVYLIHRAKRNSHFSSFRSLAKVEKNSVEMKKAA